MDYRNTPPPIIRHHINNRGQLSNESQVSRHDSSIRSNFNVPPPTVFPSALAPTLYQSIPPPALRPFVPCPTTNISVHPQTLYPNVPPPSRFPSVPHPDMPHSPINTYQEMASTQSAHSICNPNSFCPPSNQNAGVKYVVPFYSQSGVNLQQRNIQSPHSILQTSDYSTLWSIERTEDKEWVKSYMSTLGEKSKTVVKKNDEGTLKMFEARQLLTKCLGYIKDLEGLEKELMDKMTSSSNEEWDEICQSVEIKKTTIQNILCKLSQPIVKNSLRVAMRKRCKKRNSMKRRRAIQKEKNITLLKRRQQLHLTIDTWLDEMKHSVEKVKQEESLKQQADLVLSDVTRKKAEARRQLALLSNLLKLRRLRVQVATSRGERTSVELAGIFENVIDKLQKFWSDQMKEYNLEEKGLRVMLDEATEDMPRNKKSLHQHILSEWQKVMFGRNSCMDRIYVAAEHDMETFIAIRRDWDKFVDSSGALMASSMPVGWVLPVRPSSKQWEKVLEIH